MGLRVVKDVTPGWKRKQYAKEKPWFGACFDFLILSGVPMETTLAGRYQISNYLGGGGFGQTFLARDVHLPSQPWCVVKQLKPGSSHPKTLETAKRLFDREAEMLYRLGHHDQIPRLMAHFEQNHEFYLVQEYVAGHPLNKELVSGVQFSEANVIQLLRDILIVLSFVHQQQVIHRDVKPANLIRRNLDNRIVLIDFGAVKEVRNRVIHTTEQTSLTIAVGSPGYMPSEQQALQPRYSSDIYAVGIVGLQALSGLSPKLFPKDEASNEFCCAAFGDRIKVSPDFAAVLDQMVRYDYRQRYQNATVALDALQALQPDRENVLEQDYQSIDAATLEPLTAPWLSQPVVSMTQPPGDLPFVDQETEKQLERLLAEAIGPVAPMLLQAALLQALTISDLIDQLANRVPDAKRSQFQRQAESLLRSPRLTTGMIQSQATPSTAPTSANRSSLSVEFLKQCELELMRAIGPIAPLLLQRTLAQHPGCTMSQLVDALTQQMAPQTATAFRQSLKSLL